jgi:hypothetical protein
MKDNVKRVFYVRYVAHPCYLDIIAQRPEIRLDKLENESADDVAEPIMASRTPTRSAPHATSSIRVSMPGVNCSRACPTCLLSRRTAPVSTP